MYLRLQPLSLTLFAHHLVPTYEFSDGIACVSTSASCLSHLAKFLECFFTFIETSD